MTLRTRRILAFSGFLLAITVGSFSVLGYVMAVTLTGSGVAATVYAVMVGVSIVAAVVSLLTLRRIARAQSPPAPYRN